MKNTEVMRVPDTSLPVEKETNNYSAVRYNALKHGVLSKHVVLPHEDEREFDDLLAALVTEHQPDAVTEYHLVEELAGVIWRKRRVLLAEGAKINRGFRSVLHDINSKASVTVKNAVPAELDLAESCVSPHGLMSTTEEELQIEEQNAARCLEATEKALQILNCDSSGAYEDALNTLLPDSQNWWQQKLDLDRAEPTSEDLWEFIHEDLLPSRQGALAKLRHHVAIKHQVIGEGIGVPIMERLSRYETHLDRKFQRTLAMLIKLKELRGKK